MGITSFLQQKIRAFVLGPGVVELADMAYGHDDSQFSPPEYGDYIATSNGVYACTTLRAQLLSSLPLKLYRVKSNGDKQEVTSGQLHDLLKKVNPFWTFNRLIEMTELSLGLWGEAFWFLERGENGKGTPKEIWWGRPDRVSVIPDPVNYLRGYLYKPLNGTQDIPFLPSEVIWFKFSNPLDEYSGLSPLGAARLAADYASSGMKANKKYFDQGMILGGVIGPVSGSGLSLSPEQAKELEDKFDRRFRGADKAHRWAVLRFDHSLKALNGTPRDAEFLGGIRLALEDIARAYKVPLDLVGGQRTYENVDAAMKAIWMHAIIPEARFIGTDITEQLVPMFAGQADLAEFDTSGIDVLQEAEAERWGRSKEQMQEGAITINEWRKEQGMTPVPWGDQADLINRANAAGSLIRSGFAPESTLKVLGLPPIEHLGLPPITVQSVEKDLTPEGEDVTPPAIEPPVRAYRQRLAYGSPEHERAWRAFADRTEKQEQRFGRAVAELFRRQRDSILSGIRRSARDASDPFDLAEWIKRFRIEARPLIQDIVQQSGTDALDALSVGISFDILDPNVKRFIEQRSQRFAKEVNETTWERLQDALQEGLDNGEGMDALADRVKAVMNDRIKSSATTIARTEVIGASNGGTLLSWKQSGVVKSKTWIAALDGDTRGTHRAAHGQTVGLDELFRVGEARGMAPGQTGDADEDINCRCAMVAVLE